MQMFIALQRLHMNLLDIMFTTLSDKVLISIAAENDRDPIKA